MKAWLYYRLSRDEDTEMNSLQNQRQILVDYAEKNDYTVVGESFDDNVTGMTFERDGIIKIEEAVDRGDIDSANENDDLIIGFKQIVNDLYCKDISRKVTAGVRQKQKDKGLVETLPMGYYKDKNTNKICIDEEAAEIKPRYEQRIEQYNNRIKLLSEQVQGILMERITDKAHAQIYDEMLTKREAEIADLRMLVRRVTIHQNEDKSLDVQLVFNGAFAPSCTVNFEEGEE